MGENTTREKRDWMHFSSCFRTRIYRPIPSRLSFPNFPFHLVSAREQENFPSRPVRLCPVVTVVMGKKTPVPSTRNVDECFPLCLTHDTDMSSRDVPSTERQIMSNLLGYWMYITVYSNHCPVSLPCSSLVSSGFLDKFRFSFPSEISHHLSIQSR